MIENLIGVGIVELADDLSVGEEKHTVGVCGSDRVVGDHDDGLAKFINGAPHEVENFGSCLAIEVAGRFVGKGYVGARRKSSCYGHALLLASGKLRWFVRKPICEADRLDYFVEQLLVVGGLSEVERQGDVLDCSQGRDEVERLEHKADLVPAQQRELLFAERAQVGVANDHFAAREPIEASKTVHESGLARARGAHNCGELPLVERHSHIVERSYLGVARAVGLASVDRGSGRRLGFHASSLADLPDKSAPVRLCSVASGRG